MQVIRYDSPTVAAIALDAASATWQRSANAYPWDVRIFPAQVRNTGGHTIYDWRSTDEEVLTSR